MTKTRVRGLESDRGVVREDSFWEGNIGPEIWWKWGLSYTEERAAQSSSGGWLLGVLNGQQRTVAGEVWARGRMEEVVEKEKTWKVS